MENMLKKSSIHGKLKMQIKLDFTAVELFHKKNVNCELKLEATIEM